MLTSFSCEAVSHEKLRETLAQIPADERKELESFFRGMISRGDFSAVLLDEKPSSLHGICWWFIHSSKGGTPSLLMYRGWEIWKRYEHLFPMKNFSFVDNGYQKGGYEFWFTRKKFEKDILLFSENKNTPNIMYHKTLGKLLGIKKEDIEGFCEEIILEAALEFFPFEVKPRTFRNASSVSIVEYPSNYFENTNEKLQDLKKSYALRPICTPEVPFFPMLIHQYRSSLRELEEKSNWKKKVANLYNSDNFLEEILYLLTEK